MFGGSRKPGITGAGGTATIGGLRSSRVAGAWLADPVGAGGPCVVVWAGWLPDG